jgi:cytochrome c oxidase subunit 2
MPLARRKKRRGALIAAAAAAIACGGLYVAADSAVPKEKTISVVTQRFNYSPAQVTIRKGEPVVLEFTSKDVLMGFALPDFNVRADIVPGKVTRVRLVPDKTGSFTFLCDIFCGAGHEEMNGRLNVVE